MTDLLLTRSASISSCGRYRYWLERVWDDRPTLTFVMLNPSTADAEVDDPTIRRCMGFGRREGAGGIVVVNLFAWRAAKPSEALLTLGPENSGYLAIALNGSRVVCAWGAHRYAEYAGGAKPFLRQAEQQRVQLWCLGKTKSGAPRHPLYVSASQPLEPYP